MQGWLRLAEPCAPEIISESCLASQLTKHIHLLYFFMSLASLGGRWSIPPSIVQGTRRAFVLLFFFFSALSASPGPCCGPARAIQLVCEVSCFLLVTTRVLFIAHTGCESALFSSVKICSCSHLCLSSFSQGKGRPQRVEQIFFCLLTPFFLPSFLRSTADHDTCLVLTKMPVR